MTKSFERNLRILVTDGHDPAALGVIRAFGRAGHQVIAAHVAGDRPPLCLSSRHCSSGCIQPDAHKHQARFGTWLADRVRKDGLQAVVPISAAAIAACTHFRSELPASLFLLTAAVHASRFGASDWIGCAERAGVRAPRTWMPHEGGGWSEFGSGEVSETGSLRLPVVLRAGSRMDPAQPCFPGRAYYCGSAGSLSYVCSAVLRPHRDVIVQEYLPGESEYALVLRHRGEVRMHFACRSVRGAARWDGRLTSLVRMEDGGPVQEAAKLLDACDYEGLASVEFRHDAEGRRCLVGIDRSPWRGAVLALGAGLDFPGAWLDSLREESSRTAKTPAWASTRRTRVSSRSAAGTRALASGGPGEQASPRLGRLWDPRNPLIGSDRFWWSDPAPRAAAVAALIDSQAQRVLTPMTHDPGRSRLLAQAAGLAERARSLFVLAAPAVRARAASRPRSAFPLRIFMFHAVIDQPLAVPHYCFVQRPLFRRQLELIRRHFRVLPIAEAVRRLRAGELQEPSAAITFDDGFENNFTVAYPELQRLELPAIIFVATGFTDSHQAPWFCRVLRALADTRAHALGWNRQRYDLSGRRAKILAATELMAQLKRQPPDTLEADLGCIEAQLGFEARQPVEPGSPFRMLDARAISEMAASGLVEFGGHATTHSILSNLAVDGQRREIGESLHLLGRILGKPCRSFAYPNGAPEDYDEDTIGCLRDSGVSVALTAMPGANPWFGDPFELRRDAVGPPDLAARFEARIERMVRIDRLHAGAAT